MDDSDEGGVKLDVQEDGKIYIKPTEFDEYNTHDVEGKYSHQGDCVQGRVLDCTVESKCILVL